MTPEELLIPRYKVIADYPDSPFGIGEVLELTLQHKVGTHLYPAYHITDDDGNIKNIVGEVWMEDYPAIFRRMNWIEEREIKDLPEFVKTTDTHEIRRAEWDSNYCWMANQGEYFLPATLSDYEAYQKKKH